MFVYDEVTCIVVISITPKISNKSKNRTLGEKI